MFTKMQSKVINGLARLKSKEYTAVHIAEVLHKCFPDLRGYKLTALAEMVTDHLIEAEKETVNNFVGGYTDSISFTLQ